MKEFNLLGYFILGVSLWMLFNMSIDSQNPCSNFSPNPQECTSDRYYE